MTTRGRRLLWVIIGAGTLARLVYAFATVGQAYDIESLRLVGQALGQHPLHVYSIVNQGEGARLGDFLAFRWPYPPGYMPLAGLGVLISKLGLPFRGVIQLFPIAADAAIAWLVQALLRLRGASERTRLAGAALVMFGPVFFVISGYHGQVDPVAILPALLALYLWETSGSRHRALQAGLLIGLAASIKIIPGIMVLALLPSARDRREWVTLIAASAGLLLAIAAPFLIADGRAMRAALGYVGGPGLGGLSMFVQPDLVKAFLVERFDIRATSATMTLHDGASAIVAGAVAAAGVLVLRFRPPPIEAAVLLWLVVYVFNPDWFPQYMVWGLPFFLAAGHLVKVGLVQAALVPVLLLFYLKPWHDETLVWVYFAIMLCLWLAAVAALIAQTLRTAATGTRSPGLGGHPRAGRPRAPA
jgi:hypothetical protein